MSIDEVSGRELDALVAQQVFGLQVEPGVNVRTGAKDFLYALPSGDWVGVAYYSTSMAASVTVEAELQKGGWNLKIQPGENWNGPGDAHVILEHSDGRTVGAFGPINVALAQAALKAVAPAV